jgi:hypothetical protein
LSVLRKAFLVIAFGAVALFALERHFNASGSTHQLELLQAIKPGLTEESVRELFNHSPTKYEHHNSADIFKRFGTPNKPGYVLVFFAGYPSRGIAVHFSPEGQVTHATWFYT